MRSQHQAISRTDLVIALFCGVMIEAFGWLLLVDPLSRSLWGLFAVVLLLPIAADILPQVSRQRHGNDLAYEIACLPVLLGTGLASANRPMIVVASVAFSLIGLLRLLVRIGVPSTVAVGILLLHSVLFLTWPIWASNLLLRFDSQWLVDLLVKFGPIFAINAAVDPTDPFTHRPLAYRLMNLGQDIPYTIPTSVWPCVLLHVAVGIPGLLLSRRWTRVNPIDEPVTEE